ncbi:hypothetical protein BY996DRAFT_6415277 [Phakopsora pachyrhizi]|nr:hypothetical protein BY996DRAFT_6415277 [Phakopsora pachyrhizi]
MRSETIKDQTPLQKQKDGNNDEGEGLKSIDQSSELFKTLSNRRLRRMRINDQRSRSIQPDHQQDAASSTRPTTTRFRTMEQYFKRRLWDPDYDNLSFGYHSIENQSGSSKSESTIDGFGEQEEEEREFYWTPKATIDLSSSEPIPSKDPLEPILVRSHSIVNHQACERCLRSRGSRLRIYTFPLKYPGMIYIPRYLCEHQQEDLIKDCLEKNLKRPNITNLDAHYVIPTVSSNDQDMGLFDLYKRWRIDRSNPQSDQERFTLQPKSKASSLCQAMKHNEKGGEGGCSKEISKELSRRKRVDFEAIDHKNFKTSRNHSPKLDPKPSEKVLPLHIRDIWRKGKIRWCTIGYQYHWETKTYHFDREASEISELIERICKELINRTIDWKKIIFNKPSGDNDNNNNPPSLSNDGNDKDDYDWIKNYRPEAGVINFYQYKDSLTGHIDHSEVSTKSPLVSISLGHSCIFLISTSKPSIGKPRPSSNEGSNEDTDDKTNDLRREVDEVPLSMRLDSGDCLILADRSRRFFHGVPRIIENSGPGWINQKLNKKHINSSDDYLVTEEDEGENDDGDDCWLEWFKNGGRINLNIRQVFL